MVAREGRLGAERVGGSGMRGEAKLVGVAGGERDGGMRKGGG